MTVGELKALLKKVDEDLEVRIDYDENGWYELEYCGECTTRDGHFFNLISSNES